MNTRKLFVFDIDGTLCDLNEPVQDNLVSILRKISRTHRLVLASGKPFGYIAGLVRQLAINNSLIIGENGGSIMYSTDFPPSAYEYAPQAVQLVMRLSGIRQQLITHFGQSIWFQPNEVNLTVFPLNMDDIPALHDHCQKFEHQDLDLYYHKDSVDFVPAGVNKGTALRTIIERLGLQIENVYVFGDGDNDIPMLDVVKHSVTIGDRLASYPSSVHLNTIADLALYLKNWA